MGLREGIRSYCVSRDHLTNQLYPALKADRSRCKVLPPLNDKLNDEVNIAFMYLIVPWFFG